MTNAQKMDHPAANLAAQAGRPVETNQQENTRMSITSEATAAAQPVPTTARCVDRPALRAAAIDQGAELIRQCESGHLSISETVSQIGEVFSSVPPRPNPPTEAEVDAAWSLIHTLMAEEQWAEAAELADQSYRVTLLAEAERTGRTPEDLHRDGCAQLREFLDERHAAEEVGR